MSRSGTAVHSTAMLGGLGAPELLIIAGIVVLMFGAGRVADLGKGLGSAIRNFKSGLKEEPSEDERPLPLRVSQPGSGRRHQQ